MVLSGVSRQTMWCLVLWTPSLSLTDVRCPLYASVNVTASPGYLLQVPAASRLHLWTDGGCGWGRVGWLRVFPPHSEMCWYIPVDTRCVEIAYYRGMLMCAHTPTPAGVTQLTLLVLIVHVCMCVHVLFSCLSIRLSICQSVCPSVRPSDRLVFCLSV